MSTLVNLIWIVYTNNKTKKELCFFLKIPQRAYEDIKKIQTN